MVAEMVLKDLNSESVTSLYQRAKLSRAASLMLFFENIILKECVSEYPFLISG